MSWIGIGWIGVAVAMALEALYLAVRLTVAGARLRSWGLALKSVVTAQPRQRVAADPDAEIARCVVVMALISGLLAVGGWGMIRHDGPWLCACALPFQGVYAE
ncbi:hypothetical protein [Mycolicibacter arupensis]|uniref:Uncharacterized protein n=1 Tax=Mycolicibacter arupensis TaxID=342002 RepID=A0A5C7Y042_9MYCO|nr:hypothetical protein [Mycolicibacter arupensis]TXI55080.1 MAG: hypothetical protein E6Q54_13230 [Mycolicibacter arupensis]